MSDITVIRHWIQEAGEVALQKQAGLGFEVKSDGTLSTVVDRELELFFREHILQEFPKDAVLGEEFGLFSQQEGSSESLWFVDPIDGTDSYCAGLFSFAISLARYQNGSCLYAAIYLPAMKVLVDWEDGQTFLNGMDFAPSLLPTPPILFAPSHFQRECRFTGRSKLRMMGSVCFHAVQLLRGLAQGVLVSGAYLWDLAAVIPLLTANDCLFYDMHGCPLNISFSADVAKIDTPFLISRDTAQSELLGNFYPLNLQSGYITTI